MKNLTIFLLLFFINCNSQQIVTDKKYMDMEIALQKYRDIKAKYDSLVEKNKDSLVRNDGGYYKKTLYNKEIQDDNFVPMKSKSRQLLEQENKEIFVTNSTGGDYIYIYQKGELIEKVHLATRKDFINSVDNLIDKIYVEYSPQSNKMYLSNYEVNNDGIPETVLYREYQNDILLLERNYKKDFKVSKEQMLSKLPDNFYKGAIKYTEGEKFMSDVKRYDLSENEVEEFRKKIKNLKETLETAIKTKNDFYKKLEIKKNYDKQNSPIYSLGIHISHLQSWSLKIDAKTNEVLDVVLQQYEE